MTEEKKDLIAYLKSLKDVPRRDFGRNTTEKLKELRLKLPPYQIIITKNWSDAEKQKIVLIPFMQKISTDYYILL